MGAEPEPLLLRVSHSQACGPQKKVKKEQLQYFTSYRILKQANGRLDSTENDYHELRQELPLVGGVGHWEADAGVGAASRAPGRNVLFWTLTWVLFLDLPDLG